METHVQTQSQGVARLRGSWNKGKLVGQKAPLKLKEIYAIRLRLQLEKRVRELALFNLAIDSKLRGCDLVKLRVCNVMQGNRMMSRTMVMQQKTQRPVQFELTEQTRDTFGAWIAKAQLKPDQCLFPSRVHASEHISTRQYERMLKDWVASIGLDPAAYGTHTMRRTKATLIYRRTKNLRAVQLLLGHTKLESTVRYLGIQGESVAAFSKPFAFSRVGVASTEELTRANCDLRFCTLCSTVCLRDMNATNTAAHAALVLPLVIWP
jgi:integrase